MAKISIKYLTVKCNGVISSVPMMVAHVLLKWNVTKWQLVFNFCFDILDHEVFVLCNCIFCPSLYFILFLELRRQNLRLDLQILSSDFGPRYSANANCTTWPGSLNLSFTVSSYFNDTNISRFTPVSSTKNHFVKFYLFIYYFQKMSTWIWRLRFAVNVILNLSIDCGMLVHYPQGIFPLNWTVFFMNQLKIIKSISSASLTSMTFILGSGSGIMNHSYKTCKNHESLYSASRIMKNESLRKVQQTRHMN